MSRYSLSLDLRKTSKIYAVIAGASGKELEDSKCRVSRRELTTSNPVKPETKEQNRITHQETLMEKKMMDFLTGKLTG